MCLRAGKPLLVFIEDTLKSDIVSPLIPQTRFPSSGYFRYARRHIHHLQMLKSYLGNEYEPDFTIMRYQKKCLLVGELPILDEKYQVIEEVLAGSGYEIFLIPASTIYAPEALRSITHFMQANLSLVCVDRMSPQSAFTLGFLQGALVPTIVFTFEEYRTSEDIPEEFQARVFPQDKEGFYENLKKQVQIFEQDFVDLTNNEGARIYAQKLITASLRPNVYTDQFRGAIIGEIKNVQGDSFNISGGQNTAIGRNNVTGDVSQDKKTNTELSKNYDHLIKELAQLRLELKKEARTAEQDAAVGALAEVEQAAKKKMIKLFLML